MRKRNRRATLRLDCFSPPTTLDTQRVWLLCPTGGERAALLRLPHIPPPPCNAASCCVFFHPPGRAQWRTGRATERPIPIGGASSRPPFTASTSATTPPPPTSSSKTIAGRRFASLIIWTKTLRLLSDNLPFLCRSSAAPRPALALDTTRGQTAHLQSSPLYG